MKKLYYIAGKAIGSICNPGRTRVVEAPKRRKEGSALSISISETFSGRGHRLTLPVSLVALRVLGTRGSKGQISGYSHGAIYFLLDSKSGDDYANVRMEEKPSNGFNVVLYYGDELDLNSASMMVQPGSHTVVALSAQRFRVGNDPKSIVKWDLGQPPCIRNVDDYPYQHINASKSDFVTDKGGSGLTILSADYTVPFCKEDCKARYLASIYNCTCQDLQLRDAAEFCSGSNFSACSEELRRIDEVS